MSMQTTHTPLPLKERADLVKAFQTALLAMGPNPAEYSMDFNGVTVDAVLRVVLDLEHAEHTVRTVLDRCRAAEGEVYRIAKAWEDHAPVYATSLHLVAEGLRTAIAEAQGGETQGVAG